MLTCSVSLSDLWPADAVLVQRPADDALDWLRTSQMWADRSSAAPLTYTGQLPIICHDAAVRPAALQLLRHAGHHLPTQIIGYRDVAHMRHLVAQQVRQGRRLGISYGPRELLASADAHINAPDLIADLNDKANLDELLPPEAVPRRRVVDQRELARLLARGEQLPLVLKASTRLGSGAGADVLICRSAADLATAERKFQRASRVVVEAFHDFTATWCIHFALGASVRFCGVAQQVCDDAGTYQGNWCSPAHAPGMAAVDLVRHAADVGWSRGYRGFLGVDVGQTINGEYLAFDINFRNNGSTPQVVLHDAVVEQWGAPVTRLCVGIRFEGGFATMIERLGTGVDRRELVPLFAFDTPPGPTAEASPMCSLLVVGQTARAVDAKLVELGHAGFVIP
jgi:hypothetical protein